MDLNEILKLNETNISINISIDDLIKFGKTIAENSVKLTLEKHNSKLLTRKEVVEKFQISEATLWRWQKLNLINYKKIGNRNYYSELEINRELNL